MGIETGANWYHSTELAQTFLLDNICKNIGNGKITKAMFIDLSKVFNTLGHGKLIVKEKSPGLGDIAVESLPNIYFEELKELK